MKWNMQGGEQGKVRGEREKISLGTNKKEKNIKILSYIILNIISNFFQSEMLEYIELNCKT